MQGIGSPQGGGKRGNGEPSHMQSCSGGMASQSKLLLFKGPQWIQNGSLQWALQDQDLCYGFAWQGFGSRGAITNGGSASVITYLRRGRKNCGETAVERKE